MSSEWARSFLGALLLAAIGWIDLSRLRKPILSAGSISITRLTHNGKSSAPAISRDGKYVAYVHQDGDLESIWVRQIATASDVQILSPKERTYFSDILCRRQLSLFRRLAKERLGR